MLYCLPKLPSVFSCVFTQISSDVTWERSPVPHSDSCKERKLTVNQMTCTGMLSWISSVFTRHDSIFNSAVTTFVNPVMWNYVFARLILKHQSSQCVLPSFCSYSSLPGIGRHRMCCNTHIIKLINQKLVLYMLNSISMLTFAMWSLNPSQHRQLVN